MESFLTIRNGDAKLASVPQISNIICQGHPLHIAEISPLKSRNAHETEPRKPFKYNPTQKLLIKKTFNEGAAIHYALHYTAFPCKAFFRRKKQNQSQENMDCFWPKGKISVTNGKTNISGKINKFSSERCVESRFIPWAVVLITVDIYRPLQTWWRRMIMKLIPRVILSTKSGGILSSEYDGELLNKSLRQCCFLLLKHNGGG